MNQELINIMASDMNIKRFHNETSESFAARVCYSALGLWCLALGSTQTVESYDSTVEQRPVETQNNQQLSTGITKTGMTRRINCLFNQYRALFPYIQTYFLPEDQNQSKEVAKRFREIYAEVGYLETADNNLIKTASYGRSMPVGSRHLYFGVSPQHIGEICGLGVFLDNQTTYSISVKDFLCRDDMESDEFLNSQYSIIEFDEEDLNTQQIEYFNPTLNQSPSRSWRNTLAVARSIARIPASENMYMYYRVWKRNGELLFSKDKTSNHSAVAFHAYEYRRLYIALKKYHEAPVKANIQRKDDCYSIMKLSGHLPNREYYLLLLCSWPIGSIWGKNHFLIPNDFLDFVRSVLEALGVSVEVSNE